MNANSSSPLPVRTLPVAGTPKRKRDELHTEYEDNNSSSGYSNSYGSSSSSNIATFFPRPTSTATTPSVEALQPGAWSAQGPSDAALLSSFPASPGMPARDGSSSPRSRVVHRLRGLVIDEGSGDETDFSAAAAEAAAEAAAMADGPARALLEADGSPARRKRIRLLREEPGREGVKGGAKDKSPGRRAARPTSPSPSSPSRVIVDALRASLTWQEDEITVYDPDDADDDGTGVNGIGFKPTPAIARARALKRRQQLAEYRKREEREARTRRSLQRRTRAAAAARAVPTAAPAAAAAAAAVPVRLVSTQATLPPPPPSAAAEAAATMPETTDRSPSPVAIASVPTSSRRVRFLEAGPTTIHFLEPEPTAVLIS